MEYLTGALLVAALSGSTVDVVTGSNIIESAFMSVCETTSGEWINHGTSSAACIDQDFGFGKETLPENEV